MKYLLDVSALLALGFIEHEFHIPVATWVSDEQPALATCSITELGFVRVLAQAPQYAVSLADARTLLLQLKAGSRFEFSFISDNLDLASLPAWARSPHQLTDAHLAQLAEVNGSKLATLDRRIPGAFLIPSS